jgi:hypothetical protein
LLREKKFPEKLAQSKKRVLSAESANPAKATRHKSDSVSQPDAPAAIRGGESGGRGSTEALVKLSLGGWLLRQWAAENTQDPRQTGYGINSRAPSSSSNHA